MEKTLPMNVGKLILKQRPGVTGNIIIFFLIIGGFTKLNKQNREISFHRKMSILFFFLGLNIPYTVT